MRARLHDGSRGHEDFPNCGVALSETTRPSAFGTAKVFLQLSLSACLPQHLLLLTQTYHALYSECDVVSFLSLSPPPFVVFFVCSVNLSFSILNFIKMDTNRDAPTILIQGCCKLSFVYLLTESSLLIEFMYVGGYILRKQSLWWRPFPSCPMGQKGHMPQGRPTTFLAFFRHIQREEGADHGGWMRRAGVCGGRKRGET